MGELTYGVLGPLEVSGTNGPVELNAAKQRALLTILLLRANEVVAADLLIDALWSGRPPASAAKLLQVYVSQVRRALGGDGAITTRAPGYVLAVGEDCLDSARFERLLDDGRSALADGNAALARRALGEALELWRGPALADFAYDDFARAESARLEELRLAALEERIEADLGLARQEELVAELQSLVDSNLLRERLWRQLMLALYRTGRQAEALECFARARDVLLEGLGLEPGEELRLLQTAILRHDPALAAPVQPDRRRSNLLAELSPLLGREAEVDELVRLLRSDDVRLLTLAGAGGSGKTRLALEVAGMLEDAFANGVFVLELAPLRDAAQVPAVVAATLGLETAPGESVQEGLHRRLRGEELLLLVDNAEHLTDVGAFLVELLQGARGLTLLVMSRSVLHVSGERVYPVDPLDPDPAAKLFVARAQAADPRFAPATADAAIVAEICDRLDRLPLAIELAAPYVRTLTLAALGERLAQRLPLLTRGPRDLPARQQTLRATIDWSHELLTPDEQQAFRRLAVFAGGFVVEAAEEVAAAGVATLEALAEHSLLQRSGGGRLFFLETVREYALERLQESGEEPEIRRRHALWVTEVARAASLTMEAEGPMRHELVLVEQGNVGAALDWAQDAGEVELGLELATLLENYWVTNAPLEGRARLGDLLDGAGDIPAGLRALALRAHANSSIMLGDLDEGMRGYEASLAAYRAVGDERGLAIMLQRLAAQHLQLGDNEQARPLVEESLDMSRELGFGKGEAVALGILANLEMTAGNDEHALDLLERSADLSETTGFPWYHVRALSLISQLLLRRGAVREADARLREALPLLKTMGDRPGTRGVLARLAELSARLGDPERAGRLWGAAEAEEARSPTGGSGLDRTDALLDVAGPAFEAARMEGRRLALGDAIDVALAPA